MSNPVAETGRSQVSLEGVLQLAQLTHLVLPENELGDAGFVRPAPAVESVLGSGSVQRAEGRFCLCIWHRSVF